MCNNPHVPIWSVAAIVGAYSSPKSKNFEIPGGYFTLHRSSQEPLKKNRPPHRIYSLTCSLICTNPCVPIWSVAGIVGPQTSPTPHKSRNSCVGAPVPPHQSTQEPLKKNQPPNRRHSLTCSFICRQSHVHSIAVGGSVAAQS